MSGTRAAQVKGNRCGETENKKKEPVWLIFLKFIGFILVAVMIGLGLGLLEGLITTLQSKKYTHPDSLLFVLSSGTLERVLIMIYALGALIILFLSFRSSKSRIFRAIFGGSIIAVLGGVALYFSVSFDHYYDVTDEGIYYKNGARSQEQYYAFEDVYNVRATYHLTHMKKSLRAERLKVGVDYLVTMKDGGQFNAFYARQFSDNIVAFDRLLASKGVPIMREPPPDYHLAILCEYDKFTSCPDWINYIYGLQ